MYLSTMAEETTGRNYCQYITSQLDQKQVEHYGVRTLEEVGLQTARDRPREQRLAGARRPVEQHALGRLDADAQEQLRVLERQLNHLPELADLVVEPADAREADLSGVLERHVVDERVDLARQHPHDGERRHVERHARPLLEFCLVNLGAAPHDVARARGRFDYDCWLGRC